MLARIEAEPSPIDVNPEETALVVIDMQSDFLLPGGYGEALGNDTSILRVTIQPIQRILQMARERSMLIVHTREGHEPDLSDCPRTKLERWPAGNRIGDPGPMGRILIRGERGHQIIEAVAPLPDEIVIDKPGKNAFYRTNFDEILRSRRIKRLLVTGVTTDICGASTVSSANDYGYDPIVLRDCMASYDPARHEAALNIMTAQGGIWGWVSDSERVLRAFSEAL